MLNGINEPKCYKDYTNSKFNKVLFFGRLEEGKGILEFINFAIKINLKFKNKFEFIIISFKYEEIYKLYIIK